MMRTFKITKVTPRVGKTFWNLLSPVIECYIKFLYHALQSTPTMAPKPLAFIGTFADHLQRRYGKSIPHAWRYLCGGLAIVVEIEVGVVAPCLHVYLANGENRSLNLSCRLRNHVLS